MNKKFLYISPYFPPQNRVGALRPLKFARHLPRYGWDPVVLCDLWRGAQTARRLAEAVPDSTVAIYDYSARARAAFERWQRTSPWEVADTPRPPRPSRRFADWSHVVLNPEYFPLGEHSIHIPHALRAARAALRAHACDAVVVNSDPEAAIVVGMIVAKESGLPLLLDLRDPWAPCELRRPQRPRLMRATVDWLERRFVQAAARVVLNSETSAQAYRRHYADLDPARFTAIRNHCDAALIGDGTHPGFDRYTLLFLGRFRRFLDGQELLAVLAELKRRGVAEDEVQLVVSGTVPIPTWRKAEQLGVASMLRLHAPVPYHAIGAIMEAADLLVMETHSTQRLPAKLFDYSASSRPMLALAENAELGELLAKLGGGAMHRWTATEALADHVMAEMALGRQRTVQRSAADFSSDDASRRLAGLLDAITA